jgi:hypothetical protein
MSKSSMTPGANLLNLKSIVKSSLLNIICPRIGGKEVRLQSLKLTALSLVFSGKT